MCTAFFAFFALVSAVSWAQSHQEAVLELAGRQSFAKLFIKNETPALPCLPQLSNELPAPGPLSLGLDEWVNDPAIDSKWVSRFFANDCSVYKAAGVTADLYVPLIEQLLTEKGVKVKFAIHPVAGRMPGHMNVLLAEAGVPYDMIYDMDDINADFPNTTVSLVIGANDVVNPAAKKDPSSPLYGMPTLHAEASQNVIVIKRGRGAGFSGVENSLFVADNTRMLFGDGQKVASQLIQAVKEL
jgi:hypothetical protein